MADRDAAVEIWAAASSRSGKAPKRTQWLEEALDAAAEEVAEEQVDFAAVVSRYPRTTLRGAGVFVVTDEAVVLALSDPSGSETYYTPFSDMAKVELQSASGLRAVALSRRDGEVLSFVCAEPEELVDLLSGRAVGFVEDSRIGGRQISWPAPARVHYLGGHPRFVAARESVLLEMDSEGLRATAKGLHPMELHVPWTEVASVSIEGPQVAERRMTVTRMIAVGWFALAWKKKDALAFVVVTLNDGTESLFAVPGMTQVQARGMFSTVTGSFGGPAPSGAADEAGPPTSVEDLVRLTDLRDAGALTEAEFARAKEAVLRRL